MAIGIPLSSLDVAVGISGVLYVTLGLRQIDRDLDRANQKQGRAVLEVPDFDAQGKKITTALGNVDRSVGGVRGSFKSLMGDLSRPIRNPFKEISAKQTIQEAAQAQVALKAAGDAARVASAQQVAASRAATVAQQAYNKAIADQKLVMNQNTTVGRRVNQLDTQIFQQQTRDTFKEAAATATGQRMMRNLTSTKPAVAANAAQWFADQQYVRDQQRNARVVALQTVRAPLLAQQAALVPQMANAAANVTTQTAAAAAANRAAALARGQQNAAQVVLANARTYATQMVGQAQVARQYLASAASFLSPVQFITGALGGVLKLGGSLASVGGSILSVGGAALSSVGHVASFGAKLLTLPAISGPLTGFASTIIENFGRIAQGVGLVVAAVAGLSFKRIIQEGMDFEQSMSNIQAVSQYSFLQPNPAGGKPTVDIGANAAAMKDLNYTILELGADTIFSNNEVAQSVELMIRGGVKVQDINRTLIKSGLDLASATQGSVTDAAGVITDLVQVYGIAAKDIPGYIDSITGAINSSKMSLPDYSSAIRQVGPISSALGIAPDDITTMLTMLGQKGYTGEVAGTSLRNMLTYLNPRSKPAKAALQQAGLWVDGVQTADPNSQNSYDNQLAAYNNRKSDLQGNLTIAQMRLADAQNAKTPNKTTIAAAQESVARIQRDLDNLKMPDMKLKFSELGGHPVFYDDAGNLKPMDQILAYLQNATKGMSDEQKAEFETTVFSTRGGAGAFLLSEADPTKFGETKTKIGSISAEDVAAARLKNARGYIELLTGAMSSLASVVYTNWIQSPLNNFLQSLIPTFNVLLDFFSKTREDLSWLNGSATTGAQAVGEIFKQGVDTGDFTKMVNFINAVLPQSQQFNTVMIRVARGIQLARDSAITFVQALKGDWKGVIDSTIPGAVRIIGIFGTYWGNIWRNIWDTVSGKQSFTQMGINLVNNLKDLFHNLGLNISVEGPKIWEFLKSAFAGAGKMGETVWNEAAKPGLEFLWGELTKWWATKTPELNKDINGLLSGVGNFVTRRQVKTDVFMGKGDEKNDKGLLDYVEEAATRLMAFFQDSVGPALSGMMTAASTWAATNREQIDAFGTQVGTLIIDGISTVFSDDGAGLGRTMARGLASLFTEIGAGLSDAGNASDDFWKSVWGGANGGEAAKTTDGKKDTGISQEFKRAFIIMALDVMLILNLIFTNFVNLIYLAVKEVFKFVVAEAMLGVLAVVKLFDLIPGNQVFTKPILDKLPDIYKGLMDGIDKGLPPIPVGGMTGDQFKDATSGEMVADDGTILTGPNRGKNIKQFQTPQSGSTNGFSGGGDGGASGGGSSFGGSTTPGPGGAIAPGTAGSGLSISYGPDGSLIITNGQTSTPPAVVPGSTPVNPDQPGQSGGSGDGGSGGGGASYLKAPITINAYGMSVPEFIQAVGDGLEERFGGANA